MGNEPGLEPYEGAEGQPAAQVPPPQRYGSTPEQPRQDVAGPPAGQPVPAAAGQVTPAGPSNLDRLLAISSSLGFILFMGAGFLFNGWAWSWLFLMLPGLAYKWRNAGTDD